MEIQQIKNYFKQQNESEKIAKQVRDLIKQTAWQKQDMREGFTETFTPLIQSQESIKKSIDEQQNKTLEQLRANQLALTDKENKMGELINAMLLAITDTSKGSEGTSKGSEGTSKGSEGTSKGSEGTSKGSEGTYDEDLFKKKPTIKVLPSDFDENLISKEISDTLKDLDYDLLPSNFFFDKTLKPLSDLISSVSIEVSKYRNIELVHSADFRVYGGYEIAEPKNKNPRKATLEKIKEYNTLITYLAQLNKLFYFKKKSLKGSGMTYYNNTNQLLDRLELLGASIAAGNNGVIPEFSEIAHQLAKMSIITKKQLNVLLKNYVLNR